MAVELKNGVKITEMESNYFPLKCEYNGVEYTKKFWATRASGITITMQSALGNYLYIKKSDILKALNK